jgi:carboxyl-terminal processing protease
MPGRSTRLFAALVLAACDAGPAAPKPEAAPVTAPAATKPEAAPEACPSWAGVDPSTLPPLPDTPYTATFEHVWRTVLQKHYDPTLACKNWPALRVEFGAKLASVPDAAAAYRVMNELLNALGQSHFRVVPPHDAAIEEPGGPAQAPVQVRLIGEQLVVVDPASGGVDSGLPRGAALVKIGARPASEFVDKARKEALRPGEVAFHAALAAERALSGQPGQKVSVTFLDPKKNDAETTREVALVTPRGELVTLGNLRNLPTIVDHRMLAGTKVGYVAFNYWMLPMVQRVEAALKELRAAGMEALILDLRGNPGGVGAMAIPVARLLLREPGSLGKLQFRDFAQEFNVAGDANAFAGPVAVLIDEGTASTSEIFAAGLRDLGRVKIVGSRPSAGAALPSLLEKLENGALLQYVVGDYHSAKGTVAEGDGVAPDIVAPETRADFVAGEDPVLAAAIAALTQKPGP